MDSRITLRYRIYGLKATIVALVSFVIGVALLTLAKFVQGRHGWEWLSFWPVGEIGGTLAAAGMFGIAWDYADGRDKQLREDERIRRLLKESAPDFRDAVIEGFSIKAEDLKRVANPELLDSIATNVMSLRLGDEQFASELYRDIRDQAIRATERWHDVQVDLRLSPIGESGTSRGAALFELTVQWEYTTVPRHAARRFVCLSDRRELDELREESPTTIPWFMVPRQGLDPASRESFELLSFSVDGKDQAIRRSARRSGQTYTATIDDARMREAQPVRVRHLYRVLTPMWGHRLFVELPEPARNLSVSMDYTETSIADMRVSDTIATTRPVRVSRSPEGVNERTITVDVPGWLLPRTGTAFTWTLESELPRDDSREAA